MIVQHKYEHMKVVFVSDVDKNQQNVSVEVHRYNWVDSIEEEDAKHSARLTGGVIIIVYHPRTFYCQTCADSWLVVMVYYSSSLCDSLGASALKKLVFWK